MMKKIYGIDTLSLAAFRILLALFIACEFGFMVLGNFSDIYSPATGILGNAFATDYQSFYKGFTGIFFIQSDGAMKLFIWLIIAVMVLLATGFYTRIMAFTGCVLLSLFFSRYSLLYFGWEMIATVMLFWLAIIPRDSQSSPNLAFALIFQIGMIYFYNGISKNGELWMSGKAVESFLADADKAKPLAAWLFQKTGLTTILNYFILTIEIGLIFILFIPWKNKQFRYVAAFLILFLHWGIDIFVDVGNFKYVTTAIAVLLLPGDFWDAIRSPLLWRGAGAEVKKNRTFEKFLACTLCFFILFSNLSQTNASGTTDRMKHLIVFLHFDTLFKKVNHTILPPYSFFTQYWHLYSPDPPREKGYLQIEVITTNNDTLPVFNGLPLAGKRFESTVQKNLFTYLLLKKGRNEKDKIAEKCLILREIRLWNKQPGHPQLRTLQLVIYRHLFDNNVSSSGVENNKAQQGFEKIIYKTVDINYQ